MQNVLLGAERANRIDSDDVDVALDLLGDLPIVLESAGERYFSGNEVRLARYYDLTAYDAAYLWLQAAALRWQRRTALSPVQRAISASSWSPNDTLLFDSLSNLVGR